MKRLIIDSIEKQRILKMHESAKNIQLNEGYLPNVKQGDELCDIICERKQAKYGANGDVVKEIQHALAKCGFNPEREGGGMNTGCKDDKSKCDGLFRKETEKAVREFQASAGLVADGAVGKKTLEALGQKGCINLPQCDCNKKTENKDKDKDKTNTDIKLRDENKKFLEKTFNIPNINCDKILYCIRTLINKGTKPEKQIIVDELKKCLNGELPDNPKKDKLSEYNCNMCPKPPINCMPMTNKKLDPFCNSALQTYCVTNCGYIPLA